jgi:HD-like signal output (HDOD) protein
MADRVESNIEKKIQTLPLIDAGALELISILNDPNSSYDDIVARLSPDVAAQFLNTANSAYYGREVRTISYAVSLLGFEKMKQILITSFLLDHFTKHVEFDHFSFEEFQNHAHFCAAISQSMGHMLEMKNQEDIFTVSILHKIGKLIIAAFFKDELKSILKQIGHDGHSEVEAETRVLGKNHAEIGAIALKRFKIAADICNAIRYHVDADRKLSPQSNFQLELILRQTVKIGAQYQIPKAAELAHITSLMHESVTGGQKIVRQHVKSGLSPQKNPCDFSLILDQIEPFMHESLAESSLKNTDSQSSSMSAVAN